jgi:hypothetical protein
MLPVTQWHLPKISLAPFELACKPAASSRIPAFASSSLYLPVAAINSSLGILPS